jgi:BirA family biotin operon repressor/biotin-[acetyl-CoA-carboxylase] ligase
MSLQPKNWIILDSVDSTNNYAMALIQRGDKNRKNPVFSMQQTVGKGRRGKHWESEKGSNIILSIPLQMQWLPLTQQFRLSVAISLGVFDLISKYIFKNVFIKWPNDLFVDDKKAGGILIENIIKGSSWQWAVVGIGLNINQENFEAYDPGATSFKKITGENYDVLQLANELYEFLKIRIEELKNGHFETMLDEYNDHLFAKNRSVKLQKQNIIFETKITGVSSSGQLLTKDAIERRFDFDEVSFKGFN